MDDLKAMVSLCPELMKPDSHSCLISNALQFGSQDKLLVKKGEEMENGSTARLNSKWISSNKEKAMFHVESVELLYT